MIHHSNCGNHSDRNIFKGRYDSWINEEEQRCYGWICNWCRTVVSGISKREYANGIERSNQMNKTKTVQVRVTEAVYAKLQALANRDDVSIGHIVRKAIKEMLERKEPSQCPNCGSTEVVQRGFFDRGTCTTITEAQCQDCRREWEVK